MQFIDLAAQQARIKNQLDKRISAVLAHGQYIMGPEIRELEERLADYIGVKYAVSVSSGTDALLMPLMAYGIGPGDAVFVPSFTFVATAEVVSFLKATPIFVDVDENTYNMDLKSLETQILRTIREGKLQPKLIIPVDLFGQPADYDEINKIAKQYNLIVMEDTAQGFGGIYKGRKAGSLADVAATSFFPAKPLGCYGDGGMIFTDDEDLYQKLLSIRIHGQGIDKYTNIRIGINGRMDTLQAAVLLCKMDIFDEEIELRQSVANNYNKLLEGKVKTPFVNEFNTSAWAQYTIASEERDLFMANLKKQNIPTAIYYPIPLHQQEAFVEVSDVQGNLPVSEKISKMVFSLPMHPYLSEDSQELIAEAIV